MENVKAGVFAYFSGDNVSVSFIIVMHNAHTSWVNLVNALRIHERGHERDGP
jgi:hypothetical protein